VGDLEPVDRGQHDVEQDQVGTALRDLLEGLPPVEGHAHVEPGTRERHLDELHDVGVVVDDEDLLPSARWGFLNVSVNG
jgi:hypothetical protein